MASAALTNFQNLMTEVMQNEQLVFGFETPLLRLVTGMSQDANYVMTRDPNRERATPMNVGKDQFHGKKVTQPLLLNEVSSGSLGEGSTFLVPGVIDTAQATYNLIDRNTIIGLSIDAMRDTENGSSSAIKATTMYIQSAYRFHARTDNDYLHGSAVGTSATNGLLCNVSSNETLQS
ncbi:MAG TPA: hypothetical protein VNN79_14310, partial [Actinomycetota bacterium]|nr:hypothetical protein [Actinomycetota bacterium]